MASQGPTKYLVFPVELYYVGNVGKLIVAFSVVGVFSVVVVLVIRKKRNRRRFPPISDSCTVFSV